MTAVVLILVIAAVLAMFLPLISSRPGPDYYRSDDTEGDNLRKRKRLRAMLIDLRQEFDSGKMSEEEFLTHAGPLSAEMESLEKKSAHPASAKKKKSKRQFCSACGRANEQGAEFCMRCASPLGGTS